MIFYFTKDGAIKYYKSLAARFYNDSSMEVSSVMSDVALDIMNRFDITPDELEQAELEAWDELETA